MENVHVKTWVFQCMASISFERGEHIVPVVEKWLVNALTFVKYIVRNMAYTWSRNLESKQEKKQIHRIYSQYDWTENDSDATVCVHSNWNIAMTDNDTEEIVFFCLQLFGALHISGFFQWFDSKKWWFKGIEQSTTVMMASWKNWLSFQCQSFRLLPIDLSKENGFFSETSSFVIVIGAIAVFCIYFLSWEIKFSYFGFLHAKRRWNRLKWMTFFAEIFLSLFLDSQVSWLFDLLSENPWRLVTNT